MTPEQEAAANAAAAAAAAAAARAAEPKLETPEAEPKADPTPEPPSGASKNWQDQILTLLSENGIPWYGWLVIGLAIWLITRRK